MCGVAAAQPDPAPDQPAQPPPPPPPQPIVAPPPAAPASVPAPEPQHEPTDKELDALASYEPSSVTIGGFLQPQFRLRQNSAAQNDNDGFRFARARLIAIAQTRAGNLDLSTYVEAEMQPQFQLQDAYATVGRRVNKDGAITLDAGQMRVPVSRQNLLSDSRLAFVDKAQLATIAPDRDLGLKLTVAPPGVDKHVRVIGSVFNGEAKNQVENINEKFLYAGRVELYGWGRDSVLQESMFGGKLATLGFSIAQNAIQSGNNQEKTAYLGIDAAFAFKGVSGSFEYLQVKHAFSGGDPAALPPDFKANGFMAQLAYMLPVRLPPHRQARFEIGARLEEIDRNDTVGIAQPGDPEQSVREITGVVSLYLRGHSIKAQLAASHFQELEDRTAAGENATLANDQLLLQLTYRME